MFTVFITAFVLIAAYNIRLYLRTRDNPGALRTKIEREFRAYSVASHDAKFAFVGLTAEVVKEDEEVSTVNYAIVAIKSRRIARNESGEYFLYVTDGTAKPFFKHIPHSNAKILLREKYTEPPDAV
ncbi:hypothetical protein [Methyloversatilis sp.]|uniref:hypothetical protein n=1 Tax=Methyloversatilis sp. TaxID=2569862 RepID=UPI00273392D2|nr:hypothetical protein [Methyloversatilis sp.]MDP3577794.1 hypothetical protein [Methyloversatilis sp.]